MRLPLLFAAIVTLAACGPDLNSPSPTNVTGKWESPDNVSYFFNIKLDIVQAANGDITGGWVSDYRGGNLSCPFGSTCSTSNTVSGRNTVVGVSMEILGIGKFTGQLENGNVLKGDIARFDGDFRTQFTKKP